MLPQTHLTRKGTYEDILLEVMEMAAWEHLELFVEGNQHLSQAENVLVTTSDGCHRKEKMSKTSFLAWFDQLGGEGWEMVTSDGSLITYVDFFRAWFKRQRQG